VGAIGKSRGILAGIAVLAAAGMTACSANGTPSSSGQTNVQTTTPATTASAAAAQSAAAPSPTPSGIQNLVISTAEKSDLASAFVALKGISLSDLSGGGPTPGSTYYAYDPATNTYWALASFEPSSAASQSVLVGFQDGGSMGMFRKTGAGSWQVELGGIPAWCAESQFFPLPVLAAWSMPTTKPAGLGC